MIINSVISKYIIYSGNLPQLKYDWTRGSQEPVITHLDQSCFQ